MFKFSSSIFLLWVLSLLAACSSQPVIVKPLPPPIVAVPPPSISKPVIINTTPNTDNTSVVTPPPANTNVVPPTTPSNKASGVSVEEANAATTGHRGYHSGWVRRTIGTGGRANRVFYETLVATGTTQSTAGDQADDTQFPNS